MAPAQATASIPRTIRTAARTPAARWAGDVDWYDYRFVLPKRSVDAMANIKLGSGCDFLGYYMFHGGTNPKGAAGFLNEGQTPKRCL